MAGVRVERGRVVLSLTPHEAEVLDTLARSAGDDLHELEGYLTGSDYQAAYRVRAAVARGAVLGRRAQR